MAPAESIRVPSRFTAGDLFVASATPFPPYDDVAWGHALTLTTAGRCIVIPGVAEGTGFVFSAASTGWPPGQYQWAHSVVSDGDRYTLSKGLLVVEPDTATAFDPRSHARKVLDAIEAYLERADYAASRTKIADRELQNIPIPELLALRDRYRAEVRSEEIAAGFRPVARILTRF